LRILRLRRDCAADSRRRRNNRRMISGVARLGPWRPGA